MSYSYRISSFLSFLVIAILYSGCNTVTSDLTQSAIFPMPQEMISSGSYFVLKNNFGVSTQPESDLDQLKEILVSSISEIADLQGGGKSSQIKLTIINTDDIPEEGYQLNINKKDIEISANDKAGIFYGIQTLLQLIQQEGIKIPTGKIIDYPRFTYRGSMLDVSRHFFSVEDVKTYIEHLSRYKMNVLHLHLSDDQGWRIEIPGWERLTAHGGSTEVGGGEGGFYTLNEYKDIVAFANERFITIVPEIDIPGHTNAALASYPELNCDGIERELYTGTEVGFSTLCVEKEITYEFVEDVVRTISEVTPGPYFHIGGDESHVTSDEDYVIFVNRVKDIVKKYGKTMIGWDEIA
ncbi:MAG: family 20 glycosylhydrolase, partial [Saprospiraceae bacterium]|nr:family 20 glycosylhydrolase [Saprospiraceae bacterium]